ncbi:hypothetical protein [Yersinia sp. Marseille-Q3913]|uniref:hypothetical protein n=1 Tax=Yersinia sp. Marseille-Q3913 TaxID=2830769 RepID=UPI001BAE9040|nr:hypothetical protein [Yersinia sp. Marseille-Q3913]MBS0056870.1 hypothetical protein [Yersinia sp. Marseille-Q3913]
MATTIFLVAQESILLRGGKGNDFLDGGEGDDMYYFDYGDGANIISENSGEKNNLYFRNHLRKDLDITRHGSHLLISSNIAGDNLRVLVKDHLSDNGPKVKYLVLKSATDDSSENRMEFSMIVCKQYHDDGPITDYAIADMLKNERKYGINKVSSIFNRQRSSHDSEKNLAMLIEIISQQERSKLASELSNPSFIPKNVVNFITSLNQQ